MIVVLSALSATTATASAQGWCGFIDDENAPVRCGYSTITECKLAIGEKSKAAYCVLDPFFVSGNSSIAASRIIS